MRTFITLLIVSLIPALASAQTKHRRPFQGAHNVTAYWDTDGVKGNGSDEDYNCGTFAYDGHSGTDYGMPVGTTVVASAAGTVTRTNDSCPDYGGLGNSCGGYLGNWVEIRHEDGSMSMHAHMKRNSIKVSANQNVTCGQELGLSASSGSSTGPHLHYGNRQSNTGSWSHSGTRDIHKGACSRDNSLWVNQAAYKAPPGTECQDDNRPRDIDLWIETDLDERLTQGSSAGVPDALVEQTFEANIYLHNKAGEALRGVELAYLLDNTRLEAIDYVIESDYTGTFQRNDANDVPTNPAAGELGQMGTLTMNAFSDGETKRVRITLVALSASLGQPERPFLRAFVRNIQDLYAQADFGAEPTTQKADQVLQAEQPVDVLSTDQWTFAGDEPEMLQGWTVCQNGGDAYIAPEHGGLAATGQVCLQSPAWTQVDAATQNRLQLEWTATEAGDAELAWTNDQGEFVAVARMPFSYEAGESTLTLDLDQDWAGTVHGLQIRTTAPADVLISSIGFGLQGTKPVNTGGETNNQNTNPETNDDALPSPDEERPMTITASSGCSTGFGPSWLGLLLVPFFRRRAPRMVSRTP